ncbi:MAG: PQQ-binding-like beta-propeller repeat protein [Planctomycetia bacterium]|nr:PQQ-binding-like beta-propeller repeat protein [Planctomycetia bacterium]
MLRLRGIILLLLATLFTFPSARAENWPQWRGPDANGYSREQGVPLFFKDGTAMAWKTELPGAGTSTPCIWGDAVFVTAQQEGRLLVLRLSKKDGQIVWQREVGQAEVPRKVDGPAKSPRGAQKFHDLHNAASPSPVTDGEVVVVHFGDGTLAAFDYDGQQLWRRNLQEEQGKYTIWWGHANNPVLVGDLVISVCMQDSLSDLQDAPVQSYLVAHHRISGKQKWLTPRMTKADAEECDSYTTPVLSRHSGKAELIVMGGNQLDAYDAATGKQTWFLPGVRGGRTVTGPAISGDFVYATQGMRGPTFGVKLDPNLSGELNPRNIAWKHSDGTPDSSCPVVWDRWLYFVSDNGVARCLDAETGHQKWSMRLQGDYKASPIAAEGRIYFLNKSGLCTVISATSRYQKLAENEIDDTTIASPAISDGKLFIRGAKYLWAFAQ